jgi:hypothetical protein
LKKQGYNESLMVVGVGGVDAIEAAEVDSRPFQTRDPFNSYFPCPRIIPSPRPRPHVVVFHVPSPLHRAIMKPQAVEFLVHMSLATVAAAVNLLAEEVMVEEAPNMLFEESIGEDGPLEYPVSVRNVGNRKQIDNTRRYIYPLGKTLCVHRQ